jgi:sulfate/thiosulfate-binding protein
MPGMKGPDMRIKHKAAAAATLAGMLALAACGGNSGASESGSSTLNLVGYSVLEQANTGVIKDFQGTGAGQNVEFQTSYGASGDQSRAVEAGQNADLVHFSTEPDMTRLIDAGIVDKNWKGNSTKGICADSVVAIVVRKGNPKHITSWADLVKPGVGIVTPNPASSGSAKWNLFAAYGQVIAQGGTPAQAGAYLTKFFKNAVALPDSGRDATTAFTGGTGDALISYENEAILARQSGADFDYFIPAQTVLIETPCAVTKGAPKASSDFIKFQKSKEGQKDYAETGFRPLADVGSITVDGANDPSNPFPAPKTLMTVDKEFGGWTDANTKYFDENSGIVTKIQAAAGKS